ncbi:MAG: flavodoxin domain-containing protein [Candidatus Goldiibacteriota bacterium]|jgi:menaquinone-dependent protoporphyrinogen oxidase
MAKKILIVYGSHAGSTAAAAEFIGKTFIEKGGSVDIKAAKKAGSPSGYDAVVIGTNIRAGQVNGAIKSFVGRNKKILGKVPVSVFAVCLTMKDDTTENRKKVSAWLAPLKELIKPVDEGLFAGKVEIAKLGVFARFVAEKMAKLNDQDHTNSGAIKSWAENLYNRL